MFLSLRKLFSNIKPKIIKNELDYCYLTDLKIVDAELMKSISDYAEYCITNIKPLPGVVSSTTEIEQITDKSAELIETARRFTTFDSAKPTTDIVNYFKRYYLPTDLSDRILANLPKSIRKTKFEIVLIITNYGTPLHIDVCDNAIILCPIETNNEITSFWEIKDEHQVDHSFILNAFADPDKVEKKLEVVFNPGESWILNVSKIHAVEPTTNNPTNNRVIITFRWFDNTQIDDILKCFELDLVK